MAAKPDMTDELEPLLSSIERSIQSLSHNKSQETLSVLAELQQGRKWTLSFFVTFVGSLECRRNPRCPGSAS